MVSQFSAVYTLGYINCVVYDVSTFHLNQ